jgi:hypothetical protein
MPKSDSSQLALDLEPDRRNALLSAEWGVYRSEIERALRGSAEGDLIYTDSVGQQALFGTSEAEKIYVKGERVEAIRESLQVALGKSYMVEERNEEGSGQRVLAVRKRLISSVPPAFTQPAQNYDDRRSSAWEEVVGPVNMGKR